METDRINNSGAQNSASETRRQHELVALSRVSAALSGLRDLDAILSVALDNMLNIMNGKDYAPE